MEGAGKLGLSIWLCAAAKRLCAVAVALALCSFSFNSHSLAYAEEADNAANDDAALIENDEGISPIGNVSGSISIFTDDDEYDEDQGIPIPIIIGAFVLFFAVYWAYDKSKAKKKRNKKSKKDEPKSDKEI